MIIFVRVYADVVTSGQLQEENKFIGVGCTLCNTDESFDLTPNEYLSQFLKQFI